MCYDEKSNQQSAISKSRAGKSKLLALFGSFALCSFVPLSAEKNGAFIEGGFQYSNFTGAYTQDTSASSYTYCSSYDQNGNCNGNTTQTTPASTLKQPFNGNLFGADIQFGYKQFFGKKKRFGLRYYGFFSGQGGPGSYKQATNWDDNGNPTAWAYLNQPSANLFYGVGIDALFNFYEKKNRTFGVFAGVMIGGSSWLEGKSYGPGGTCQWGLSDANGNYTGCGTMNQYFSQMTKSDNEPGTGTHDKFSPTFVQFVVNIGFRSNLTKHTGFEVGIRIPTINTPYWTSKYTGQPNEGNPNTTTTITFRRTVAIYANYVYNF
ncbi:outer membrane protein [Helicobacter heilmannii]|uniref:outer membrane protein n=1 Tax=Helicobacter heilmannii TaxID=35817 RepID=UPI0006A0BD58|nr:outer membrane protein [Helicobacter heilmannii]CRF45354.1 outer membrane protein (omp4) [Helicobacter heilmannii]